MKTKVGIELPVWAEDA